MPYITKDSREHLEKEAEQISTPGELNYVISRLIDEYVSQQGMNYTTLNSVVGVLECAKNEFYRRVVVPYEDQKLEENGEVYKNAQIFSRTDVGL